ncbi:bifunctional homocysteine S-methyltransferase/methylenetetrahydrofolate reductase, partial [Microbacteriaceae bacterium K1510]|nr:bifunctional homocysteine S-methyltransferase/methylenetetrahydrofolate reductase [Microbacteriaceae bacterium K1510]
MATQLHQMGAPIGFSSEELCLSNPRLVYKVHEAYYAAGARLLETNTYAANRESLSRYGLESKVTRINREAVGIAREAAKDQAYVVGSIGSIVAGRVRRQGAMNDYRDQFEEQAIALLHAGVDGIILETFLDLDELLLAVDVIRPLTGLPIISQLATIEVGRTRDGLTLSEAFRELKQAGADIVGLNCRLGPAEILRSFESTIVPEDLLLSAFPNAGRLGLTDGEYAYKSSPEYFGESALRLREQGIHLIGGCCGTTPEHIRAISTALAGLAPLERVNPELPAVDQPIVAVSEQLRHRPSIVEQVQHSHTIIVEFDPPKDLDAEHFLQGCCELHRAGADSITLADNSLANVRMSNMALGAIMKSKYGIDPLLHLACRDRNLIGQQSHLMGLHALGIDQILVVTGDPSRFGDLPGASSVFDVTSFDLIRMVKQLNEG